MTTGWGQDPPDWEFNPDAYQFSATIVGALVMNDGEQMGDDGDLFAAFDHSGNVRGLGLMIFPPFGPHVGTPLFEVQLRSNNTGDLISFKYYDASEDAIFNIAETYEFIINDQMGDVESPIIYNVENINGCTDPEACNYDETANVDDGSCEYAQEYHDCDGNCRAEVDCAGTCGGSAVFYYCCDECVGGIIIGDCDADDDGACDDVDNCPEAYNPDQSDSDSDGLGDACDPDDDNDGCVDWEDPYPFTFSIDTDTDGEGNDCDDDDDGDGCLDEDDQNPLIWSPDTNGNGLGSDCDLACPNDGLHNGYGFWFNDDCFCCECNNCDCEDWCGICFDSLGNESDCYLNDNCFSNQYQDWYEDLDGDGLCDYNNPTDMGLCTDFVGEGLPDGCEQDPEPNCATNDTDECGVCGSDGSSCGGIDYCLDLHSGANLISFYALPDDVSITHVMSSVEGNATGVIGEGVAANYNGTDWVGSLNTISSLSGYWVIVSWADPLCIEDGNPTDPAIQYSLHSGANLISFPVEGSVEISYSLPDDIEGFVSGIIG